MIDYQNWTYSEDLGSITLFIERYGKYLFCALRHNATSNKKGILNNSIELIKFKDNPTQREFKDKCTEIRGMYIEKFIIDGYPS